MRQHLENYRGKAKVEFLALLPDISKALKAGHNACSIYEMYKDKLSCSVRQFQRLIHNYKRQAITQASSFPHSPTPRRQPRIDDRQPPKKPQSFKHNSQPDKDYFASSRKPQSFKHNSVPDQELIDSLRVSKGGVR